MWPHYVCLLNCPRVTPCTGQTCMHNHTHSHTQTLTAEQGSIFNCADDVRTRCHGAFPDDSSQEVWAHVRRPGCASSDSKLWPTAPQLRPYRHICPRPQASCLTFNYNNVWLSHDSSCCEQSWRVSVVPWTNSSWWVRVNTAQTPAELLVKMEALIRLCFGYVTETPIRAKQMLILYTWAT